MSRLLAALLAALCLAPTAVLAQETRAPAPEKKDEAAKDDAARVDPAIQAAIQKALEKAKEEIRNEVRAELQGAQSAAEFMGTVAEGPKLQFFQLEGYFRLRGDLLDNLSLGRDVDTAGYRLFPVPLQGSGRGTLSTANMRLRLEPTFNVSERVRVKMQVDVLDNYVLGSSTSQVFDSRGSPYPVPFYGSSRELSNNDPTQTRPVISPKRVWGEVQTPVGLLSFGRMPSAWGLGILSHAGQGLDSDFGDTVDRIQFALPPVETPLGNLTIVPMIDFDSEGVLNTDPRFGAASGQPFDAESGDDARTYALKLARLDTEDEIRRKQEAGGASLNYGLYYNYRTQRWTYPAWTQQGLAGDYSDATGVKVKRGAYAHVFDFWTRWLSSKWRVEGEVVGVYGQVANAFAYDATSGAVTDIRRVLLRQWGAVLQADYQVLPSRVWLGGELGLASGDPAPGFGNATSRLDQNGRLPAYGAIDGPQFGQPGDNAIRNFRFNPAYRVDSILWRRIMGQVTDAWYLKPSIRWDVLPGLRFDGAAIYSQAMDAGSTPSAVAVDSGATNGNEFKLQKGGKKPLGLELDTKLTLDAGDGFVLWGETAVLQPFGGLGPGASRRGWALSFGMAARF